MQSRRLEVIPIDRGLPLQDFVVVDICWG
jgi:hypothetical protein